MRTDMTQIVGIGRIAIVAGLLASAVHAQSVVAEPAWGASGDYTFNSYVLGKNGAPVCVERWRFDEDDIKTITTNSQSLRMKFKFETDGKQYYLVEEKMNATQPEDCLGGLRLDSSVPRRYPIVRLNNGGFFVCKRLVNPLNVSDCYGRVFPERSAKPN